MEHSKTASHSIRIDEADVVYIQLPGYESGKLKANIRLMNLVENYRGPDVMFDFLEDGTLVGIEILA